MERGRLLVDPPQDGTWNMALDQALLDAATADSGPVLRFYRWSEATLSLGYFQASQQRHEHSESRDCPMLRRSSGGGAIVHDQELTYSLIVPIGQMPTPSRLLYDWMHQAVCNLLHRCDLAANLFQPTDSPTQPVPPFLCFLRRAQGDVVVASGTSASGTSGSGMGGDGQGNKVMGSAQRKGAQAILQHGSLLLSRSRFAPQLPGIDDLMSPTHRIDDSQWIEHLCQHLQSESGWEFTAGQYTAAEIQAAQHWQRERFANENWTHKR